MPSTPPRRPAGLEVWLHGTREEVDAAGAALAAAFTIVARSAAEPLPERRRRLYLRGYLPTVPAGDTTSIPERDEHQQCEIW